VQKGGRMSKPTTSKEKAEIFERIRPDKEPKDTLEELCNGKKEKPITDCCNPAKKLMILGNRIMSSEMESCAVLCLKCNTVWSLKEADKDE
jgi:hypothetical protein